MSIKANGGLMMGSRIYNTFFLSVLIIILLTGTGSAQNYELGTGDVLQISVWGHSELTTQIEVRPDGYITFPLVGDQYAVGKTPNQLATIIQTELANYVVDPQVTVLVHQFRTIRVQVLGEVRQPGYFSLSTEGRLMDVIGLAGGPTQEAVLSSVALTRTYSDRAELFNLNISEFMETGNIEHNPILANGDVIHVSSAGKVLVLGEVTKPGSFVLREEMGILDLLALAGSPTDRAALDRVTITRETDDGVSIEKININEIQRSGTGRKVTILAGDVLFVPEGSPQVLVLGNVRNPGSYRIHPDNRLLDVIALAGGTLDTAGDQILVTRDNNTDEVDLGALTRLGLGNQKIGSGDVIYVPEGRNQLLILGEVANPGYHSLEYGDRILDGIAKAGGLLETAGGSEVTVTRQETETENMVFQVDLDALMTNRFLESNFLLEGGDVIIIPKTNRQVMVLGEVRNPGSYTLESGQRVLDLVSRAGGMTNIAATDRVQLTRVDSDGNSLTVPYNIGEVIRGYGGENPQLLPGDILFVPESNQRVLVFGEVRNPGAYTIDQYTTLLDLIGLAGGTTERALIDQISVTSVSGTAEQVQLFDLDAVIANREPNMALTGGDVIFVPESRQVIVMGEVARPGSFTLPREGRILDLLALSGGTTSNASAQEIIITRQGSNREQVWIFNYDTIVSDQHKNNLLLEGGDVVFVPEISRQVLVLGEVAQPGVYNIYEGARILDAIALAGGPSNRASLGTIGIYRDGDIGGSSTLAMGEERVLFQGDAQENPLIQGGDVIFVPETTRPDWNQIFGFMGGIRTFQQIVDGVVDWFRE